MIKAVLSTLLGATITLFCVMCVIAAVDATSILHLQVGVGFLSLLILCFFFYEIGTTLINEIQDDEAT